MQVIHVLNNLYKIDVDNLENILQISAVMFSFLSNSAIKTIPASEVILPLIQNCGATPALT